LLKVKFKLKLTITFIHSLMIFFIYLFLGPGLKILHNLISKIKPSDVVQLKFDDNQDLNLHSKIINNNTKSSLSYNLWHFTSTVKNKLAKAPYLQ